MSLPGEHSQSSATYLRWKDWSGDRFMRPTVDECIGFQSELGSIDLAGRAVLEIGFGNGGFLAWARARGGEVWGSETEPELLARAADAGVRAVGPDLSALLPERAQTFALVAAWDVLEHVPDAEIPRLLATVASLLAEDGLLVLRFPNGQSPLGRVYQHGDVTHCTTMSGAMLRQLIEQMPYRVERIGNPARRSGLKGAVRHRLQGLVERGVQLLYGLDAPLAPNTVAVLRRTSGQPA